MTSLPHRFKESTFRLYESDIDEVVKSYPDPVVFHPKSVETYSCRFRDSIRSVLDNHWTTFIDVVKLLNIRDNIRVSIQGSAVVIGHPDKIKQYSFTSTPSAIRQPNCIINPNSQVLNAICVLHHYGINTTPTKIQYKDEASPDLKALETQFDIVVEGPDNENIWTIL